MDPNNSLQVPSGITQTTSKTNKKLFLIIGAVTLLIILAITGWIVISRSSDNLQNIPVLNSKPNVNFNPSANLGATLALNVSPATLKVGETFVATIEENANQDTGGTDIIIFYDPKILSVETTGINKSPVQTTNLYNEYPLNRVDGTKGVITVSGINSTNKKVVPKGIFGTIVFRAELAGKTQISFDFKPGMTTSSNIVAAESAKNILEKVVNAEVTIKP